MTIPGSTTTVATNPTSDAVIAASAASAATTDRVRSQFGAVADAYITSSYHANGADLVSLVRIADLHGTEQVLDLGCGAGHAALAIAPHAAA